jgi:hypothetical protein
MTDPATSATAESDATRFRRTLIKVMTVQIISLLLLWWLQTRFTI